MDFNTIRKKYGLTLAAVSEKSGIPMGSINVWSTGKRSPTNIKDYIALAKAFGCRFEELLDDDLKQDYLDLIAGYESANMTLESTNQEVLSKFEQDVVDRLITSMDALKSSIDTLNELLRTKLPEEQLS